ncbi:MAG: hypothetical protein ACKO52_08855 [Sediminibacterium sp.]
MQSPVFLITPPFTQLNTPYPATAYIKAGYLAAGLEDFDLFWDNKPIKTLHKAGLLRI